MLSITTLLIHLSQHFLPIHLNTSQPIWQNCFPIHHNTSHPCVTPLLTCVLNNHISTAALHNHETHRKILIRVSQHFSSAKGGRGHVWQTHSKLHRHKIPWLTYARASRPIGSTGNDPKSNQSTVARCIHQQSYISQTCTRIDVQTVAQCNELFHSNPYLSDRCSSDMPVRL